MPLCTDADTTDDEPKRHHNESDASRPEPDTVTTVPPVSGPDHGDTPLTSTSTTSSSTPSDVKSTPFVVTSTVTYPGDMDELLLHTTDVSLTYSATTVVVLKRHLRYPSDADNAEKQLPDTVTGVPPSDTDDTGHTDDTAADTTYVYSTPLELN